MSLCPFLKPPKVNHQIHSNSNKIHVSTSIRMNKHNEWPLRKILDKLYMFFLMDTNKEKYISERVR